MKRLSVLALSLAALAAVPMAGLPVARAQDASDLEMEKYQFSGVVNADNVYVRSGSSENDYPVLKLNKGDTVVVVGQKLDWLKILPPEGSFCLVSKAWVDKRGDGTVGRVREDSTNVVVRIGSNLNNMIQKVAVKLQGGDDVHIVGEQDEYFRITPPAGTVMFVHKKFIDPLKRVEVVNNNGQVEIKNVENAAVAHADATPPADRPAPAADTQTGNSAGNAAVPDSAVATNDQGNSTAATGPGAANDATNDAANNAAPATQPTATDAAADFDKLEAKFNEASTLPIEQQPIDELIAGYQNVVDGKKVPESMLRIAEFRLKGLKVRQDTLKDLAEVKRLREQMAAKQQPLEAEAREINQRIEDSAVKHFDAVGTLRPSALTNGGQPLYRLTDPASGHTVVYLLTNDAAILRNEGLFIGVNGPVTDDPVRRIKILQPKSAEQVAPAAITNGEVSSALLPASLMPAAASR